METKRVTSKRRPRKVPRSLSRPVNSMILKQSWTATSVISGTSGTATSWTSPTIYASSEYSVVQSLFTEVRLLSATAIFGPVQSANGTLAHGTLVVSTNMLQNQNTGVTPTGYVDVQNQTRPIRISTLGVREIRYRLAVPRNLEFAGITADAPNPATPWAGSPGIVAWYMAGVTASTTWFTLHMECVWELRGRQ